MPNIAAAPDAVGAIPLAAVEQPPVDKQSLEAEITALKKRLDAQEQNWSRLKWGAGIVGAAVLLVTGFGFVQIPIAAKDKAIAEVTPIAKAAAEEEVKKKMPDEVTKLLDALKKDKQRAADAANAAEGHAADASNSYQATNAILKELSQSNPLTGWWTMQHAAEPRLLVQVGSQIIWIAPNLNTGEISLQKRTDKEVESYRAGMQFGTVIDKDTIRMWDPEYKEGGGYDTWTIHRNEKGEVTKITTQRSVNTLLPTKAPK